MDFLKLPFFAEIVDAGTILLAGAGGGFDIFTGLPLYFGLRAAGKTVHLANLSFSHLYGSTGRRLAPALVEVTAKTEAGSAERYFPEQHLARWFALRGEDVPIYGFYRTGAKPIAESYRWLADHLRPDAVILVDGGTDSLMRGDEAGLGTPEEDMASIAAVAALEGVPIKLLVCLGFGIDAFHGVCHAQFLEAVAALARDGDFLGAWTLTKEMPEVALYREAVDYVVARMPDYPSIVNASIVSAIEGRFGDYHATRRTENSDLFINTLMTLYWCFRLDAVARRSLYLDAIRETGTYQQLSLAIERFRATHEPIREWTNLPL